MHTRMCLAIKQNIEYSEHNKLVSYTMDELTEDLTSDSGFKVACCWKPELCCDDLCRFSQRLKEYFPPVGFYLVDLWVVVVIE